MKIITSTLSTTLGDYQLKTQAQFQKGYGTRDHTMKLLIVRSKYNIHVFSVFVDFEKISEYVERWVILHVLRNCGIDQRCICFNERCIMLSMGDENKFNQKACSYSAELPRVRKLVSPQLIQKSPDAP